MVSVAESTPLADDQAEDEPDDAAKHEAEDEDGFCGPLEHGRAILVQREAGPVVKLVRLELLASRAGGASVVCGPGAEF
jgi:hypothetical protein